MSVKSFIAVVMIGTLLSSILGAEPLKVGDDAPDKLKALNQAGEEVDLGQQFGKGLTFVFFYPKAMTGGCTAQACSVRDTYKDLREQGVTVYGVSLDSTERQKKFQQMHKLPYDLIADTDKKVADAFGVPHKLGMTARQAYLIKDGKIVWADYSASTRKQGEDLQKVLENHAKKAGEDA